jgi:hypothetical protein
VTVARAGLWLLPQRQANAAAMSAARRRPMHANAALLDKLFTALRKRDHQTMASCYHPDPDPKGGFHDIAFDLAGREEIHAMWRMICRKDVAIRVEAQGIGEVDDETGRATLVETYAYHREGLRPRKVPVRNVIESRFRFRDGLIWRQDDDCDPRSWARQALGRGPIGFLAGRIRLMRRIAARRKLSKFTADEARPAAR